jgi:hypothetical protein
MSNEIHGPAFFRRFVGLNTRFRFQLKGHFFPLDGVIECVSGPKVRVHHPGGDTWVVVSRSHPKFNVVSVDILGEVV